MNHPICRFQSFEGVYHGTVLMSLLRAGVPHNCGCTMMLLVLVFENHLSLKLGWTTECLLSTEGVYLLTECLLSNSQLYTIYPPYNKGPFKSTLTTTRYNSFLQHYFWYTFEGESCIGLQIPMNLMQKT